MKTFDVVIVGGGLTGATCALALSQLSRQLELKLSIALIETNAPNHSHKPLDIRSIALSAGSIDLLKKWKIWSYFTEFSTPISSIHVSDQHHIGSAYLDPKLCQHSSMGHVIELDPCLNRLYTSLQHSGIDFYCPAHITSIETSENHHVLSIDHKMQVQTKLLLACDGSQSTLKQQFGLEQRVSDFDQVGFVANVTLTNDHHQQAFERFTKEGPLALLPLSDKKMSLVWAMSVEQGQRRQRLSDDDFLHELQEAFGFRLGRFESISSRAQFPLQMTHLPRPYFHRCIFLGNSAQMLHPIAGQGFNLGIRDIASFMDTIQLHQENADDLGKMSLILEYVDSRKRDREFTMRCVDGLVRLFSTSLTPLVVGRNVGLTWLSILPFMQEKLMMKAMGFHSSTMRKA